MIRDIKRILNKTDQPGMASSIRWHDRILIIGSSHSKSGFHIDSAPYIGLPAECSKLEIGNAVRTALDKNDYDVKDPDFSNKSRTAERFKAANVRSEKEFMKRSQLIIICKNNHSLSFTPTQNGGASGTHKGFQELQNYEITIDLHSSGEIIGDAVIKAWYLCTFK